MFNLFIRNIFRGICSVLNILSYGWLIILSHSFHNIMILNILINFLLNSLIILLNVLLLNVLIIFLGILKDFFIEIIEGITHIEIKTSLCSNISLFQTGFLINIHLLILTSKSV